MTHLAAAVGDVEPDVAGAEFVGRRQAARLVAGADVDGVADSEGLRRRGIATLMIDTPGPARRCDCGA
ncbi:MAG TPA: hypothetical protein VNO25_00655 [Streptosporangiaceae bacterium]|jgi:hypothetical protein|nr:hypothetical protein [Streptosporangiaceae bacterium]